MPLLPLSFVKTSRQVEDLLDQVRELKDVNSRLFKLVSDKDFEIRRLKRKIEEDQIPLAGMVALIPLTSWMVWQTTSSSFHLFRYSRICRGRGSHQDRRAIQKEQRAEC